MPQYWTITNRVFRMRKPSGEMGRLSHWISDKGRLDEITHWNTSTAARFLTQLAAAADIFPLLSQGDNAQQKHACFLIHSYNNGFEDAAHRYQAVSDRLSTGSLNSHDT